MNDTNTLSISELRQKTALIINDVAKSKKPKIVLQRSKPKAVLVDVDYFQSLEEMLLDITDVNEAEKAKKEPKSSFKSYIKRRWDKTS